MKFGGYEWDRIDKDNDCNEYPALIVRIIP